MYFDEYAVILLIFHRKLFVRFYMKFVLNYSVRIVTYKRLLPTTFVNWN
jgi:hypothetical protein